MKQILALATLFLSQLALACPGGNLLQMVDRDANKDQMLIANYDVKTGRLINISRSFQIISVVDAMTEKSICLNNNCATLAPIQHRDIKVTFKQLEAETQEITTDSLIVESVSIGANVPMPRATPGSLPYHQDLQGEKIFACSQH